MAKITYQNKVSAFPNNLPEINKFTAANANELKQSINALYDSLPAAVSEFIIVDALGDLPNPVAGVITLAPDTCYYIVTSIDLLGSRMVGSANTTILGTSSETCNITSTGLGAGIPLFSTQYTTPIRHVSFKDVDTALNIQGTANSAAYDWTGVNFVNIPNIGVLDGGDNWIFSKGAFINSQGLEFRGTWATIGIDNSLFRGNGTAGTIFKIGENATITRRTRMIYSAVVAFGSTIGLDVDVSATVPIEGFILDTVSFSGGGTYLGGLVGNSLYALFSNCTGISNTYEISNYYMNTNVDVTDIVDVNTPVKVGGTTTSNPITRKFTNTDNRATYTGGLTRIFDVSAIASVLSNSSNDQIGFYIAKNGVVIESSKAYLTTGASNRAENIIVKTVVELATNDYIEIWADNATDDSDITVTDLNVIVKDIA